MEGGVRGIPSPFINLDERGRDTPHPSLCPLLPRKDFLDEVLGRRSGASRADFDGLRRHPISSDHEQNICVHGCPAGVGGHGGARGAPTPASGGSLGDSDTQRRESKRQKGGIFLPALPGSRLR